MDIKVLAVLISLVAIAWLYGFQKLWDALFPKPAP